MSTPVNGPDDVRPGDLVRYDDGDEYRQNLVTATVVKATAARMTVLTDGGATVVRPYTRTRVSRTFRTSRRYTTTTFARLDARELWWRAAPSGDVRPVPGAELTCSSAVVSVNAIRDRPDDVCAQIRALSEWLQSEPSKEAP